jgi:hypothetical protein
VRAAVSSIFFLAFSFASLYCIDTCSADPTRYRISQDVYSGPCPDLATSSVSELRGRDLQLFCATYEFKYPSNVSLQPACTTRVTNETFSTDLDMRDHTDMFLEFIPTDCLLSSNMSPSLDDAQNEMYHVLVNQNVHNGQQYAHLPDIISNPLGTPASEDFGCYNAPPSQSLPADLELPDYASIQVFTMSGPSQLLIFLSLYRSCKVRTRELRKPNAKCCIHMSQFSCACVHNYKCFRHKAHVVS